MIVLSLIVAITINILTSCYVCYSVAIDTEKPLSTVTTVTGVILINALVPFTLGCLTGLWYVS